jgi:hypothetical protein
LQRFCNISCAVGNIEARRRAASGSVCSQAEKCCLETVAACLLIGKIYKKIGADYFLIYFLDEKIEKLDKKVQKIYFEIEKIHLLAAGGCLAAAAED